MPSAAIVAVSLTPPTTLISFAWARPASAAASANGVRELVGCVSHANRRFAALCCGPTSRSHRTSGIKPCAQPRRTWVRHPDSASERSWRQLCGDIPPPRLASGQLIRFEWHAVTAIVDVAIHQSVLMRFGSARRWMVGLLPRLSARSCPSISESSLTAHSFFRRERSATNRHVPAPCLELRTGTRATAWTVVRRRRDPPRQPRPVRAVSVPLTTVNPGQPRQPAAPHQRTSTSTAPHLPMIRKLNTRFDSRGRLHKAEGIGLAVRRSPNPV